MRVIKGDLKILRDLEVGDRFGAGFSAVADFLNYKSQVKTEARSIGSADFTGTGSDDCTSGGTYTGDTVKEFYIEIDSHFDSSASFTDAGIVNVESTGHGIAADSGISIVVSGTTDYNGTYTEGTELTVTDANNFTLTNIYTSDQTGTVQYTPNTFKWSNDGGDTFEATEVAMTLFPILLEDGVILTWGAITGHHTGDIWEFTVKADHAYYAENSAGINTFHVKDNGDGYFAGDVSIDGDLTVTTNTLLSGTVNIDGALDVDAATQLDGTLTVGVNDTGHDVKFFGATADKYWLWDESADKMIIAGAADIIGALTITTAKTTLAAPTTTYPSLNMPAGTDPTSPADGDIWHDSTNKAIKSRVAGVNQKLSGHAYSAVSDSTISNTSTETAFDHTFTLPANLLTIGKTIRIQAWGRYSTKSAPVGTIQLTYKLGATVIGQTNTITPVADLTHHGWFTETIFTCRTIGTLGTIHAQGRCVVSGTDRTAGIYADMRRDAADTINTEASQAITLTAKWAAADTSNSITCTNLIVEVLN